MARIRSRDLSDVLNPTVDSAGLIYGALTGWSTDIVEHEPFIRDQAAPNCRCDMEATVHMLMSGRKYLKLRRVHVLKKNMPGGQNSIFKSKKVRQAATFATDERILSTAASREKSNPAAWKKVLRLWAASAVFRPSLTRWAVKKCPAKLKKGVTDTLRCIQPRGKK